MGSDALDTKGYGKFLQQYCGVRPRDWQTKEDYKRETDKLEEIIRYLQYKS